MEKYKKNCKTLKYLDIYILKRHANFCEYMYKKSVYLFLFTTVVQVVLDITTFYMQTYKKFTTTEDQRLKETLRVIHTGVSELRHDCSIAHSYEFSKT